MVAMTLAVVLPVVLYLARHLTMLALGDETADAARGTRSSAAGRRRALAVRAGRGGHRRRRADRVRGAGRAAAGRAADPLARAGRAAGRGDGRGAADRQRLGRPAGAARPATSRSGW